VSGGGGVSLQKILPRLLVFFVGVPALALILLGLPQWNHLAFNLVAVAGSALGAVEFRGILVAKGLLTCPVVEAAVLGALCPLATALAVSFDLDLDLAALALCLGAAWTLGARAFTSRENLPACADRITAGFSILVYPGFFMSWIIRLAGLPHAETVILVFLLVVFLNDSAAWAAGVCFGRGNQGLAPASPNKSVAGFIGGMAASVLCGALAPSLFPAAYAARTGAAGAAAGAVLGLAAGAAAVLGDLGESALKRSAGVKDSGVLIPGRGGVLDSIDSLALAAPVYWLAFTLFF